MSSLPLISHHLFVAAVKSKRGGSRRPVRREPSAALQPQPVLDVPWEVLEFGPHTAGSARTTRATSRSGSI